MIMERTVDPSWFHKKKRAAPTDALIGNESGRKQEFLERFKTAPEADGTIKGEELVPIILFRRG
jgi:hypothetical protein